MIKVYSIGGKRCSAFRLSIFLINSFVMLALSGLVSCASLGPEYTKATIPPGKAIIYIYRPDKFAGSGASFYCYDITEPIARKEVNIATDFGKEAPRIEEFVKAKENGRKVVLVHNNGYYPYIVNPGKYHFIFAMKRQEKSEFGITDFITTIDAKTGEKYFIATGLAPWIGRPWAEKRNSTDGEKEIAKCKLLIDNE